MPSGMEKVEQGVLELTRTHKARNFDSIEKWGSELGNVEKFSSRIALYFKWISR